MCEGDSGLATFGAVTEVSLRKVTAISVPILELSVELHTEPYLLK